MSQRIFFTVVVVSLCLVVNAFVGMNDVVTLIGLLVAALMMRPVVKEFQMGSRIMLANHFNSDESVHSSLTKPSILVHAVSFVASFVIAVGFFVVLKGVMLSHGAASSMIIIAIATLILFPWITPAEKKVKRKEVEEGDQNNEGSAVGSLIQQVKDPVQSYATFVASVISVVLVLNIILALILSAKDLGVFVSSDLLFSDIESYAVENAIGYSGANAFSRSMINAYLLSDSFKLALGNELFASVIPDGNKSDYFYGFYFVTFLMNLVKLMPLSVGFVIFIGGVRRHSDELQALSRKAYGAVYPKISQSVASIKSKARSKEVKDEDQSGW